MGQKLANLLHVVWFGALLYLWNSRGLQAPDYDTISVALTSLEVVLVVAGIFGFTYFSFVAERKAKEVADAEAKRLLEEVKENQLPPLIEREVRRAIELSKQIGTETATEEDLREMMQSLDKDERSVAAK